MIRLSKKKTGAHPHVIDRLITLAEKASASDSEDFSLPETRLATLVSRLIDQGWDGAISRARDYLETHQAHDAADRLAFWAEDAASTLPVGFSPQADAPPSPHAATHGHVTTFLIPLILVTPDATPVPLTVPLPETVTALVRTLRQCQLINGNATITLQPGLYRLADLPTQWSDRRQWLHRLRNVALNGLVPLPAPTPEPQAPPNGSPTSALHLRFLVGAVRVREKEESPEPIWAGGLPLADAGDDRLDRWHDAVTILFATLMPHVFVAPGVPGLWSDAINQSLHLWNRVVLDTTLAAYCRETSTALDDLQAEIRWQPREKAWQVTFVTPGHASPSWRWMGRDKPQYQRHELLDTLEAVGIRRIVIDARGL